MNQPARKLRGCADLELSKMQAVAAEREANTPTPSPAPEWTNRAAKEIRGTVYWPRDINESDVPKIEAIITKHAAALSEENRQLGGGDNLRLTQVKESYQQRAYEFSAQLTTLRLWSEQAREAMETVEYFLRCLNKAGVEEPSIANYYKQQAGRHLNEVLIPLLQSHPAKGMEGRG